MKQILGMILKNRPRLQELFLKLSVYPRFLAWTKAHPVRKPITGIGRDKRNHLFQFVSEQENLSNTPILYAEFGVHKGESIAFWSRANTNVKSIFLGFDSFEGLPETWLVEREKGFFSLDGKVPETNDPRVRFCKGWFHKTVHNEISTFRTEIQKVIHFDADLYRSTIYPMMQIGPTLRSGDILIFDEFLDSAHEFRAFEDLQKIFGFDYVVLGATQGFAQVAIKITTFGE